MSGSWRLLLERLIPAGADADVRRRSHVLIAFVAILDVMILLGLPVNLAGGRWLAAFASLAGAAIATLALRWLRRGLVSLTGHLLTGLFVLTLMGIGSVKGGLAASEIAWQCAAIVFAVLVLGSRGALLWTLVACAGVVVAAYRFDASVFAGETGVTLARPAAYAFEVVLLYVAVWAIAIVFDRARAEFLESLSKRNDEMRRVLEHARDGLLTIDREGRIGAERSAQAIVWLGPIDPAARIWDALGRESPEFASWLQLGWEGVIEDFLPRELTLSNLPRQVTLGGLTLELSFTVMEEEGVITGALVVLHDITGDLAQKRAEAERREVIAVFEHARTDAAATTTFLDEIDRLVTSVVEGTDVNVVWRDLHTIKGSCAMYGLDSIVELCHAIEERSGGDGGAPSPEECRQLAGRWAQLSRDFGEWRQGQDGARRGNIADADVEELRAAIMANAPHGQLAATLDGWKLTPMTRLCERLARQGTALATRLGKDVDFIVAPSRIRVDEERLSTVFSSLVHVIRNAIDHGIEEAEERQAGSKPVRGEIRLVAYAHARGLLLEVCDDGRGVDWDGLRRKANSLGLPAVTESDLVEAMFSDGVSTRAEASLVSGRGVGLAAVRQAVVDLGGEVKVVSQPRLGTRIQIHLPKMAPAGQRALRTLEITQPCGGDATAGSL
jgi:HPt (histidine-containing phosphotransfer) domain-containing protein/PAS domain-containing protein/two-component sensor histidine kinase